MVNRSQRGEAYNTQINSVRIPTTQQTNTYENRELGKQLQQTAGKLLAAGNKLMK